MEKKLEKAAQLLKQSSLSVALTGAGMSAESGIPTFRGKEGLWKNFSAQELANPQAFAKDPQLVWQWYNWRKDIILQKQPNAGHYALAQMQEFLPLHLVTQNVDNLHRVAGSQSMVEIHGNIFKTRCLGCGKIDELRQTNDDAPLCRQCNTGQLRPDIVWFGESLAHKDLQQVSAWLSRCEVILVIGTSGQVYPAAGFAAQIASQGGSVIEINPQPATQANITFANASGEVLPLLLQKIKEL